MFNIFLIFKSNLLQICAGQDITIDILQYLCNDDIKRLIPKIGAQICFRENLKNFLNRKTEVRRQRNYILILIFYIVLNINLNVFLILLG